MIDYQIEEDFLGTILLKPEVIKRIVITDKYLLDTTNRFILNLLKQQYKDYQTISITGLIEHYSHLFNTKFQQSDIISKMTRIINETMPIDNFDYYQETLFLRYIKFKILESINNFHQNKISTEEMLNDIHKYESMNIQIDNEQLNENEIYRLIHSKNKNIDLRYESLSNAANIQEHDLVIVAARPGIGKTGFILNILEDLSSKYKCILFNMEMSEKQVFQRLVSITTEIPMKYFDKPATEFQNEKIKEGCKKLAKKKIKIYNQAQTITSIRRKILKESKDSHTIVFIDYVGLIGTTERNQSIYERVTAIVKELRQISLDYNCTIFLVSQINRNSEKEKDKTPKISDLKESGELEQSATTVIMLHDENHNQNISKNEIEMSIIIGKNRNGRVGITKLTYNKENQRFDNVKKNVIEPNSWRKNE